MIPAEEMKKRTFLIDRLLTLRYFFQISIQASSHGKSFPWTSLHKKKLNQAYTSNGTYLSIS